ncbi:MAG: PIG-L family deacetylase, partial [Lentisphaerae bacterium]|nr:PIG-L family deacetylase [Lentisphaerota bacterium]
MGISHHKFVAEYARLFSEGVSANMARGSAGRHRTTISKDARRVLLFSPHPDDECITGALPLRLLRELKLHVINIAVTLGSRKDRRPERLTEMQQACEYLGFGASVVAGNGLEKIRPETRTTDPETWHEAVNHILELLRLHKPDIIFFPHAADANSTHQGVQALVTDALAGAGKDFCCWVCETEYWAAMDKPNLMIESSVADIADLVTALALHTGEVKRNPYHLRLPAWMMDNVRRGSELLGGQGGEAPAFIFATLYRLRKWAQGRLETAPASGRM